MPCWQRPTYYCDTDPLITVTGTHLSLTRTHLSLWQGPTYHCDRDPLITVTRTHLSLWQGPTYYCDTDPLITVTGTHLLLWQGPIYHCLSFISVKCVTLQCCFLISHFSVIIFFPIYDNTNHCEINFIRNSYINRRQSTYQTSFTKTAFP
jgi:hypothetical protein